MWTFVASLWADPFLSGGRRSTVIGARSMFKRWRQFGCGRNFRNSSNNGLIIIYTMLRRWIKLVDVEGGRYELDAKVRGKA